MCSKYLIMKKILLMLSLFAAVIAAGRDFDPKDTWAYLYENFTTGNVYNSRGDVILTAPLNVSVVDGKLHYVQDDKIMEADMLQVYTAIIEKDTYMNAGGKMLRILSKSDKSAVLEEVEVDMDKLSKAEIGYGISSATASVQGLHMAAMSNYVNTTFKDASEKKGGGERIPVKEHTYLLSRGTLVMAKKREVLKIAGLDRKAAEAFFKSEKIKWNNNEDLQKVADYISDNR